MISYVTYSVKCEGIYEYSVFQNINMIQSAKMHHLMTIKLYIKVIKRKYFIQPFSWQYQWRRGALC